MNTAPTCEKCGRDHYPMQTCERAAALARRPERFLRRRDGARDFGNRVITAFGRDQGNTIVTFIPRIEHPMYLKAELPKEAT